MCLNEATCRIQVDKHLSHMFLINNDLKQGDVLSQLVFNFAFRLSHYQGSGNQDGIKLNGTHKLLVYIDNVVILGGSVLTIKKNT